MMENCILEASSLSAMDCIGFSDLFSCPLYRILLKKSGVKTPRIELEEMGPSFDLVLRRHQTAPPALYKTACRTPKALKVCLLRAGITN